MASSRTQMILFRHGETDWSRQGKHTGRTDVPLNDAGHHAAALLLPVADTLARGLVRTSPLLRAKQTCQAAGMADVAQEDPDLMEWDYGQYEGLTTTELRRTEPDWELFRHGCPGGESAADVAARADAFIGRVRNPADTESETETETDDAVVFAHGHLLRVLAARWIKQPPELGRHLRLETGRFSLLGYKREDPVIHIWNAPIAALLELDLTATSA